MRYKILEARIEFKDSKINRIIVLVDFTINPENFVDIRPIFADTVPKLGYMHVSPIEPITDQLLHNVASFGLELLPAERDRLFPNYAALIKEMKGGTA